MYGHIVTGQGGGVTAPIMSDMQAGARRLGLGPPTCATWMQAWWLLPVARYIHAKHDSLTRARTTTEKLDELQLVRESEDGTVDRPTPSDALLCAGSASDNRLHYETRAIWCCCTVRCSSDNCAAFEKIVHVAVADGSIQGRGRYHIIKSDISYDIWYDVRISISQKKTRYEYIYITSTWYDMIWYDISTSYHLIWYDIIPYYIKSRIQLCGELGSTRLGSGKRVMVKTMTLPIGSSVPTKNGCWAAVYCS